MDQWFTVDRIDEDTYIISEYRHWEETHCYLLNVNCRKVMMWAAMRCSRGGRPWFCMAGKRLTLAGG